MKKICLVGVCTFSEYAKWCAHNTDFILYNYYYESVEEFLTDLVCIPIFDIYIFDIPTFRLKNNFLFEYKLLISQILEYTQNKNTQVIIVNTLPSNFDKTLPLNNFINIANKFKTINNIDDDSMRVWHFKSEELEKQYIKFITDELNTLITQNNILYTLNSEQYFEKYFIHGEQCMQLTTSPFFDVCIDATITNYYYSIPPSVNKYSHFKVNRQYYKNCLMCNGESNSIEIKNISTYKNLKNILITYKNLNDVQICKNDKTILSYTKTSFNQLFTNSCVINVDNEDILNNKLILKFSSGIILFDIIFVFNTIYKDITCKII